MFDKPKIVLKKPEIVAIAVIVIAFLYAVPNILKFHDQISLTVLLGILVFLHVLVLWLSLRLFRLYEERISLSGLHTAAADIQKTMKKINELSGITIEAQRQFLETIRETKRSNP